MKHAVVSTDHNVDNFSLETWRFRIIYYSLSLIKINMRFENLQLRKALENRTGLIIDFQANLLTYFL